MVRQCWLNLGLIGLVIGATAMGCNDDDTNKISAAGGKSVALSFSGLSPLQGGSHYEGWAVVAGEPVSTGKFNVGADGSLVDMNGNAVPLGEFKLSRSIAGAAAIVISVESTGDDDAYPSLTHILGGNVVSNTAQLKIDHPAALRDNFADASGKFVLATPSNEVTTDEKSGIWWMEPTSEGATKGLNLPRLPEGWVYEGWVVVNGVPVSTGTFTHADFSDNSEPHGGIMPSPTFPGEDFLANAPKGFTFPVDLSGAQARITVEATPDDAPAPSTLKVSTASIPTDAATMVVYTMENTAVSFPTGTAILK
ncbi:MAG: hypothetical protein O3A46_02040 [Candidatus Poribacteria bacterium]|nr:hypothetical protein [Candidatus Poribacteria bacterium]